MLVEDLNLCLRGKLYQKSHHHHQPFNIPTAKVQAFLMDYT
jgi:hypothetical protein